MTALVQLIGEAVGVTAVTKKSFKERLITSEPHYGEKIDCLLYTSTESSVGANILRAMRSHKRQNAAPPKTHPGSTCKGFALRRVRFTRCGTAMPTKEIGPANAVTLSLIHI